MAAAYAVLLIATSHRDVVALLLPGDVIEGFKGFRPQFFPTVASFGRVMANAVASVWLHIMVVNVVMAREIRQAGQQMGLPVVHSLILCSVLAPLGYLSHVITKYVLRARVHAATPRVFSSLDGQIILEPY